MFERDSFRACDLILVKKAPPSRLVVPGAFVRLNSGSPVGVVTELDSDDRATVHWIGVPGGKMTLPEVCLSIVAG